MAGRGITSLCQHRLNGGEIKKTANKGGLLLNENEGASSFKSRRKFLLSRKKSSEGIGSPWRGTAKKGK